jgi:Flp pilus assembly protein TadD/predicted Ser/Thr protein kinase/TolB-like protein
MLAGPGSTLGHYRLIKKVGEGGMGAVWKAEDKLLGRTVAIKVLRPDVSRDEKRRQMFLDEARLASSVSHAHMVQIHDFGRESDVDFIVMEYVEGTALDRVLRGRVLSPDKVASLGAQIAGALAKAHRKGLLHRDLKPANILVTPDGDVKVADFGLATLFEPVSSRSGSDHVTRSLLDSIAGSERIRPIGGTVPYMSPEQVRGDAMDQRSDIFSLGIVLYEMTTGTRPFSGADATETLEEIVRARPTPVHELKPKVPLDLDRIIQKTLAKRRADRYQTMDDLAVDLKRLSKDLESGSSPSYDDLRKDLRTPTARRRAFAAVGACAVIVAALLAFVGFRDPREEPIAPAGSEPRMLVLPFDARGFDRDDDYVGRVAAERIAISMSETGAVEVAPLPTNEEIESVSADAQRAAHEANAQWVVSGTVHRGADESTTLHVTVVDVHSDRLLTGLSRTRPDGRLSQLLERVSRELGGRLGFATPDHYVDYEELFVESPLSKTVEGTRVVAALRHGEIGQVVQELDRLHSIDPDDFEVAVVRAYARGDALDRSPSDAQRERFDAAIERVRALDPNEPYSDLLLARYALPVDSENIDADSGIEELLHRVDVSSTLRARVLSERATKLSTSGRYDEALEEMRKAAQLDPTAARISVGLARILSRQGEHVAAIEQARRATLLAPHNPSGFQQLGLAHQRLEQWDAAALAHDEACRIAPEAEHCVLAATAYLVLGQRETAFARAQQAAEMAMNSVGAYNLACFWALAGDPDAAVRFLREAVELGYREEWILEDPDLESLRGDPRFHAIIADMMIRGSER